MELNRRNTIMFFVGVLGGAGTVYTLIYLRKLLRKSCTRTAVENLVDKVSLETLKKLSEVPNVSIRRCTRSILTARALKPECLRFLIQLCYAEDEESVLKACIVLESLTKNPKCRASIIYFEGLEGLSHAIYRSWARKNKGNIYTEDGKIQHLASMAIFDLINGDDDPPKTRLLDKNPSFLPTILGIIKDTSNREIEKWGLYIIHQIVVCEATRDKLCQHWVVIEVVSKLVVKSQGEPLKLRLAFQVLVTLANILMANVEENVLQEIKSYGVLMPMIGCLKSENRELVYWAIGLLHEFVALDIALPEICAVPILLRSLHNVLISSEASIQRLVLRVLRFLCESSEDFKTKTIHNKQLLARLPICLASGDNDVASWSLYLIHDISKSGIEAIELLFEHSKGIIEALVEMCGRNIFNQDANTMCRYIAETLGFFCSVETIQCEVVKAGALKAVLQISMMDDIDMKFWSTSLLLNLSMSAEVLKEEIVKSGGVKVLIDLAVNDTDEPQIAIQAAKTLVMLGFLDSPFVIDLKSSSSSSCSVLVNNVEHSRNDLGINVVVLDPITLTVEETESFDTGHFPEASIKLTEYIQSLPLTSMVFLVVRGEGNFFLTDDAKEALASVGVPRYEYRTGELWLLCGQKRYGLQNPKEIEFKHGYDNVHLTVNIPQGYFVNDQVKVLIMEPLLDLLMSTPPESNISRVSELMLLTIFARHDSHRIVMLEKEGFLEYMAKMIWNMASRSLDDLRSNTMLVAHCLGAMKTVAGLMLSDTASERSLRCGVLKEVLRLLLFINGTLLDVQNGKTQVKSNLKSSELSFLTPTTPGFEEKAPFSVCDSPATPVPKSDMGEALPDDTKCNYEDFEESFITLTQLAVAILYHFSKRLELPDDSLYTSLSVNVLWCTLLTCKDELRRAITIPVENMITCLTAKRQSFVVYSERQPVCLNDKEKTQALMLSCDKTEVINFNWSFESAHANVAVGRRRNTAGSTKPAGWYYEVQVMTQGIMQIGWRTNKCEYSPEKGIGVGDDIHSCAFDGARLKVWNGPACRTVNNDYGEAWAVNDIISCLFSWDGDVSFWLNGVDLGVAFENMNPDLDYYPAVSLAMDQHCCFNFGGDKSFRYAMPDGYIAVSDVLEKKSFLKRPRSISYTKGSFESIAEEDEESLEDVKNIRNVRKVKTLVKSLFLPPQRTLDLEYQDGGDEHQNLITEITAMRDPEITRLQRCSSSEPSLHGNENSRGSHSEETRRFSTSTSYHGERPSTPDTPMSWASTVSTPFTPVTPLSPFWSPSSSRNTPDLFSGIPCVYFETEVNDSGRCARNVGYYCQKLREHCSCEFYDGQTMSFPSPLAKNFDLIRAPSVIGCGLLWPDGVFFTLDGVYNNTIYPFSQVGFEEGECLPYITYPNMKVNYGQEEFLMERANSSGQRLASAQLLHSFSRHLLEKFS